MAVCRAESRPGARGRFTACFAPRSASKRTSRAVTGRAAERRGGLDRDRGCRGGAGRVGGGVVTRGYRRTRAAIQSGNRCALPCRRPETDVAATP